jgi:hypothetical protein
MKKISVTLSVVILCFLLFEIYQIKAVSYQLDSPLIPVSTVKYIIHPYIVLAVVHGVTLFMLIGLYFKSLFRVSTIIAVGVIITTFILNYFCLLCA